MREYIVDKVDIIQTTGSVLDEPKPQKTGITPEVVPLTELPRLTGPALREGPRQQIATVDLCLQRLERILPPEIQAQSDIKLVLDLMHQAVQTGNQQLVNLQKVLNQDPNQPSVKVFIDWKDPDRPALAISGSV